MTASNRQDSSVAIGIRDQIHDLRLDLQRVEPEGIAGKLFFWWLLPVKFVADPVFQAAETIVPPVISAVPLSNSVVASGLGLVETISHAAYGVAKTAGLLSSSNDEYEGILTFSRLLTLVECSPEAKETVMRNLYEKGGNQLFLQGIHQSSAKSLSAHPTELLKMMWDGYGALYKYASENDILNEVDEMGRIRYFENKALLAIIQQADLEAKGKHRMEEMLLDSAKTKRTLLHKFPMEEARYFVKFAVAAYGDNGIKSSKMDSYTTFDCRLGDWTTARVSQHTGIPEQDLVMLDVNHDPNQLRHFVAIDRLRNKIILAIRGTYTHREVMIDFNGYSREFLGGEAHAAISIMAERLWEQIGGDVIQLLDENPGFELIVTGHSLGGGSTCLVNMLLHQDERMAGRQFRAFAYASPPVYAPGTDKKVLLGSKTTCVNYINQYDAVPFLCGDTVRHQIAMVAAVEKADLDLQQRAKLLLGLEKPDMKLISKIHKIQRQPLPVAKQGCPRGMRVPVMGNVWIWPDGSSPSNKKDTAYKVEIADSFKMSKTGIFIHKDDLADHLPARYEYVLNHLG